MIKIMDSNESFFETVVEKQKKVIIYGAGTVGERVSHYINNVEFFCDKKANEKNNLNGIKIIKPENLAQFNQEKIILVCVRDNKIIFQEVCNEIKKYAINVKIYNFFDNNSFQIFSFNKKKIAKKINDKIKINIICNDNGWILEKIANKLEENLKLMGIEVKKTDFFDKQADVNHYISYGALSEAYHDHNFSKSIKTSMITHIDCSMKLKMIKMQSDCNTMGICMSRETMDKLAIYGIPREKICYINPAQDGEIKPKKFTLGITHKTHTTIDHRKRTEVLLDICREIDSHYFKFKIMGSGWGEIVNEMRNMEFEVEYFGEFDYDRYKELVPTLDYYLFFGYDEGSMGYLDALAAGVETIVTPQGFHLDIPEGITYPCETINEFVATLNSIKRKKEKRVNSIESLTWQAYAEKHLEVWNYLSGRKSLGELMKNKHKYNDGIFSVFINDIAET